MDAENAPAAGRTNERESKERAKHEETTRPTKRPRISNEMIAAIHTRCVQEETSLEVDIMILDYIAYQCTQICLQNRTQIGKVPSQSPGNSLTMSDAFLSIFKERHSTFTPDAELRFRILLLKLTTLFTQRLTRNPTSPPYDALLALRTANQNRARNWIGTADRIPSRGLNVAPFEDELPLSMEVLMRKREYQLQNLGIPAEGEDQDPFYGTSSCVSFLDILPMFMQISAMRNSMCGSGMSDGWIRLACEFMLQACLEQYLVYGADGADAIDEAFAWGYRDPNTYTETSHENRDDVNDMFEDDDYAVELKSWTDARASYLAKLPPTDNGGSSGSTNLDLDSHLLTMATQYPITTFESTLLKFLEALSNSIPKPLLVQLEMGKVDGMDEKQTRAFLIDCGLSGAEVESFQPSWD